MPKQNIRTKNRNYYRKECKKNAMTSEKLIKYGDRNTAEIYIKRAYNDYDKYVKYGGKLKFSQITK